MWDNQTLYFSQTNSTRPLIDSKDFHYIDISKNIQERVDKSFLQKNSNNYK